MAEKRYYYKAKSGKGFLNLKTPLSKEELKDYVEIEKEEFDSLTAVPVHEPTEEEVRIAKAKKEIAGYKKELADTDYVVIKIAECESEEIAAQIRSEYASVIAHRKEIRAKINILEDSLNA